MIAPVVASRRPARARPAPEPARRPRRGPGANPIRHPTVRATRRAQPDEPQARSGLASGYNRLASCFLAVGRMKDSGDLLKKSVETSEEVRCPASRRRGLPLRPGRRLHEPRRHPRSPRPNGRVRSGGAEGDCGLRGARRTRARHPQVPGRAGGQPLRLRQRTVGPRQDRQLGGGIRQGDRGLRIAHRAESPPSRNTAIDSPPPTSVSAARSGPPGRLGESGAAYGKAIAAYETLVAQQPMSPIIITGWRKDTPAWRRARPIGSAGGVGASGQEGDSRLRNAHRNPAQAPELQGSLGLALTNLGESLAGRGNHGEAVPLRSESHQLAASALRPPADGHRLPPVSERRLPGPGRIAPCPGPGRRIRRGDPKRIKSWPGKPAIAYEGARALALCIPAWATRRVGRPSRTRRWPTCRAAVAAGWSDGVGMGRDIGLEPLRGRDDFRRLVEDVLDRTMPDEPFTR